MKIICKNCGHKMVIIPSWVDHSSTKILKALRNIFIIIGLSDGFLAVLFKLCGADLFCCDKWVFWSFTGVGILLAILVYPPKQKMEEK